MTNNLNRDEVMYCMGSVFASVLAIDDSSLVPSDKLEYIKYIKTLGDELKEVERLFGATVYYHSPLHYLAIPFVFSYGDGRFAEFEPMPVKKDEYVFRAYMTHTQMRQLTLTDEMPWRTNIVRSLVSSFGYFMDDLRHGGNLVMDDGTIVATVPSFETITELKMKLAIIGNK